MQEEIFNYKTYITEGNLSQTLFCLLETICMKYQIMSGKNKKKIIQNCLYICQVSEQGVSNNHCALTFLVFNFFFR